MKQVLGISLIIILTLTILAIAPSLSEAASIQYYYDDIGRLIATVSNTGEVTIYSYDEVGNVLSITKDSFTPNSPVIQGINPDILFIGTTTVVSITGQNLLTTKKVLADNPNLSIAIITVTDTEIELEITTPSQVSPGPVNLTVVTQYGSASAAADLTKSQLSFSPGLLSVTPGGSGSITALINPPVGKAETIQIGNSDPSVLTVPKSVLVPANGAALFTVSGVRGGVSYVGLGMSTSTVYVTTAFTPVSGEQLTSKAGPVSVYIDSPQPSTTTGSLPVSAYIDTSAGNSSQVFQVSVSIDAPSGNSAIQSFPLSVSVDSPAGSSAAVSLPVSIVVDSDTGNSTTISNPVSAKIQP